jgi:hypothetical protein
VLVLPCVEQVLSEHLSAGFEPEMFWRRDSRPKAIPTANRAVAAIGALPEIKVCREANRTAMAATLIGFQH